MVGVGGSHSYQMLPSFILLWWHAIIKLVGHSLKIFMLFDVTCCLHSFLLFTRVSRVLASPLLFVYITSYWLSISAPHNYLLLFVYINTPQLSLTVCLYQHPTIISYCLSISTLHNYLLLLVYINTPQLSLTVCLYQHATIISYRLSI